MTTDPVALVYTDEGPGGPCGQGMHTTSAWTRVYVFDDEDAARSWLEKQPKTTRRRVRWAMVGNPETFGPTHTLEDRRRK